MNELPENRGKRGVLMCREAEEAVLRVHDRSMEILERTGIRFRHAPSLEILKKHGVRVEGEVAFFTEKALMDKVALAPETFMLRGRNSRYDVLIGGSHMEFAPPFGVPFVRDSEGLRRPATLRDFVLLTKFFHQQQELRINGGILCQPNDQDQKTAALLMLYALIMGTDKSLICPSGMPCEVGMMLEMLGILFGGIEVLQDKAVAVYPVDSLSPLQFDGGTLETIRQWAGHGQPLAFSAGVIAGLTGPVTLPGAFALGNAEILAGIAFSQMINEGNPALYGSPFAGAEMKRGSAIFGGPERAVAICSMALMARHYGVPSYGGGSTTDAPVCGEQSGYESFMTLERSCSEGVNCLSDVAGVLESFKVVCLEKCLIDMEQLRRLIFLDRAMAITDDQFPLDLIERVGHGGDYLTSDHTLAYFRESLFNPDVGVRGVDSDRYGAQFIQGLQKKLRKVIAGYRRPELCKEVGRDLRRALLKQGVPEAVLRMVDAFFEDPYCRF